MSEKSRLFLLLIGLIFAFPSVSHSQDSDGDGMPDAWETSHSCLMVSVADDDLDSDSDGLSNLAEYLYSTSMDPCDPDTDADGMPDQWVILNGTNASVADAAGNPDTDGLSNTDEVMVGSDSLGYYDQNVFEMFLFVGRGKGYNTP